MADRDQILAEFQAFTGIEDFEHSIAVLQQHDWNLMEAVQNTMAGMDPLGDPIPNPDPPPPSYSQVTLGFNTSDPLLDTGFRPLSDGAVGRHFTRESAFESHDGEGASSDPSNFNLSASAIGYSPSTSYNRLLNFKIEHRDRTLNIVVPDHEAVGKIKELIQQETQLPPDKQKLSGWVQKNDSPIKDTDILRELRLPKENTLYLIADIPRTELTNGENQELVDRLSQHFQLVIKHKGKAYPLNFPGSKTVREVKSDVYSVINVPVRHQVWTGWPPNVEHDDAMTLAGSGISHPCHNFEVNTRQTEKPSTSIADFSSEDDLEENHFNIDADEDMIFDGDVPISKKQEPLMPENAKDQSEALEHFVREFSLRYGDNHPVFYIGSLEDALKDSLLCKARDRKLLAIYLHHDSSIQSNVFCSQILCSDAVTSFLTSHFLLWAWDLTTDSNKARLLTRCTRHFGSVAANTVRNFKADELPLLLIISRTRGGNEVVQVIKGNTSIDELVPQLMHCVEVFQQQVTADIAEEDAREARENIKLEQEMAYQESLMADRAKAETKKREEEKIRQAEEEKLKEEQQKEAIRQSVANTLPDEPSEDCDAAISTLRFRCPGGTMIIRRFLADSTLQVLLNFVVSKGYHLGEHKVLTTFPKRDLTSMECEKTLKELKLFPQETLIIEEK